MFEYVFSERLHTFHHSVFFINRPASSFGADVVPIVTGQQLPAVAKTKEDLKNIQHLLSRRAEQLLPAVTKESL